jgi:putative zinc finger protein
VHLDDPHIQSLLDRELPPRDEDAARAHLRGCAVCRGRADEARREGFEIAALLETLDAPLPRIDATTIVARADATPGRERARFANLRRAAALLLVVGLAGAVYAFPGSPVRTWVRDVARRMAPKPNPSVERSQPRPEAGISILPEERLLILFRLGAARGNGIASLSLTDGSEVQVHAPPGAATFSSAPGRLEIDVRDVSAPFVVELPRSAPWIEIRADETPLFLKTGSRVTTEGPAESGDRYTLRLERRSPARAR